MSRFRNHFLAGCAALMLAVTAARGAVEIADLHVTNIGTTTFTVVWTTSEVSRPGLDVFSDAAGTTALNPSPRLEFYPIAEGDRAVVNSALEREGRRSLETLAINRRTSVVRVSGVTPGTTYHIRPRSFASNGTDNGAAALPLRPVTTAQFSTVVPDGRLVRLRFPAVAAEGMIALVHGPVGTAPLSAIIGDSTTADTAIVAMANLLDTVTGTNALLDTPQPIVVKVLGAGAPAGTFTQTINFSSAFSVSTPEVIETDLTSPAPVFTLQPANQTRQAGASVTFNVAATGTPAPTFTWQRKPASGSAWSTLANDATYSGVSTATLTISDLTLAMNGDEFRAFATNGVPPDATSTAAVLTVQAPPAISSHPQSVTIAAGQTATFNVTATGTGALTYVWQRRPAGSTTWQELANGAPYADATTASLKVINALFAMSGDEFRCVISDTMGSSTSTVATLSVKAPATIALSKLRQFYDGTARSVATSTTPSGLAVEVTYNGSATAPVTPGVYTVLAQIKDAAYAGSATGELVVSATALVRRAPTIAGGVDGSVHVLTPEAMTLTGWVSSDLLVRGTPTLSTNGTPTFGGLREGTGATEPGDYSVTLDATAALRYLVRRVDALTWPVVTAPPAPTGTRNVALTAAGQTAGDFSTVRNLSVSGTVGLVTVPPGTYGNLTANGSAGFVLGVAGATEPAVYNLQNLSINPLQGTARLVVAGPVIINVAGTVTIFGTTGAPEHPEWLTLTIAAGNMSVNGSAAFHGFVLAPNTSVTLNGRSTLTGAVTADRLNVTATAELKQAQP